MTASDERCELTELIVEQCGCPTHRGGRTPEEQIGAERTQVRSRLLSRLGDPRFFAAQYPGACSTCDERFEVGAAIRQRGRFDRPAKNDSNWIAECCSEGTS